VIAEKVIARIVLKQMSRFTSIKNVIGKAIICFFDFGYRSVSITIGK